MIFSDKLKFLRQQLIFNDLYKSCFSEGIVNISEAKQYDDAQMIEVSLVPSSSILLRTTIPQDPEQQKDVRFQCIEVKVQEDLSPQVLIYDDSTNNAKNAIKSAQILNMSTSIPVMVHFMIGSTK